MATKRDVIERAYRFIRVVAGDEPMTADQEANGDALLDSIYLEITAEAPPSWTIEDIDAQAATFLALALAADLATQHNKQAPMSRGAALIRLYGTIRPDDRPEIVDAEFF